MKAPHLEITGQEGWSGREEGSRLSPFCLSCSERTSNSALITKTTVKPYRHLLATKPSFH